MRACVDHPYQEECALDYCASCGDPDTVPPPEDDPTPPLPTPPICKAWGDPHYVTYASEKYNFQGTGLADLALYGSLQGEWQRIGATLDEVHAHRAQAFNCPIKKDGLLYPGLTQGVAFAAQMAGHVVTFFQGVTKVDGKLVGHGYFYKGDMSLHVGSNFLTVQGVEDASGDFVQMRVKSRNVVKSVFGYVLDIYIQVPRQVASNSSGLCAEKDQYLVNDTFLFSAADLRYLEQECCPSGKCGPPEGPPPTTPEVCEWCPNITVADAMAACVEHPYQEECALDYCASCGDNETLPPPDGDYPKPPLPPPPPKAIADPHCRNLRGENFDVHATGNVIFLNVPRKDRHNPELQVRALISKIGPDPCAPTVIRQLFFSGKWLNSGIPLIVSTGEHGEPEIPSEWRTFMAHSPKKGNLTLGRTKWGPRVSLGLQAHGVSFQINQREGRWSSRRYLDLKIFGLETLGDRAGGILGMDSHEIEALPVPGCDGRKSNMRLNADEEDEETANEEPATGGLLSMARVM